MNDHVSKNLFDQIPFKLHFPTIGDLVSEINADNSEKHKFKIDIARAFRNLRVDPANTFKFGIKWEYKYYIDIAVAFGWVHRSMVFQMVMLLFTS